MLIVCPWCGARPHTEFHFGGEAAAPRPTGPADAFTAEWLDHTYLRNNVRGAGKELWFHAYGCERWIKAVRDTATHHFLASPVDAATALATESE